MDILDRLKGILGASDEETPEPVLAAAHVAVEDAPSWPPEERPLDDGEDGEGTDEI